MITFTPLETWCIIGAMAALITILVLILEKKKIDPKDLDADKLRRALIARRVK